MITDIRWLRTFLCLESDGVPEAAPSISKGQNRLMFENRAGAAGQPEAPAGKTVYTLSFSNAADSGTMLPEGDWLLDTHGEAIAKEVLEKLPAISRIFSYGLNSHYLVIFRYDHDNHQMTLRVQFVKHNKHPERRRKIQDVEKLGLQAIYRFWRIVTAWKGHKRRVLFLSQSKDDATDNMRAVMNRLEERNRAGRYKIETYFFNDAATKGLRQFFDRLKLVRKAAGSNTIFIDNYVMTLSFVELDPQVRLIQLWHAGVGYKLVGYARFGIDGSPHPYQSCHRQYTLATVGNEALKDIYSEVFGISKDKLIATGMPRLDHYLDPEVQKTVSARIYEKYPQLKDHRLILFAPTYRGRTQELAGYDFEQLDMQKIAEMCRQTDSLFVFKWHHFIQQPPQIPAEYADRILDLSGEDLNELMYVSDILITDYSSCFYDFLLLQRPILFYLYDEEQYSLERGVHEKVSDTAPGIICHTFEEMMTTLSGRTLPKVEPKPHMVDMCLTNGTYTASDRVLDAVFGESLP